MPDWSSSLIFCTSSAQLGPDAAAGPGESAAVTTVSCGARKASALNPAIIPTHLLQQNKWPSIADTTAIRRRAAYPAAPSARQRPVPLPESHEGAYRKEQIAYRCRPASA